MQTKSESALTQSDEKASASDALTRGRPEPLAVRVSGRPPGATARLLAGLLQWPLPLASCTLGGH